MIILRRLQRLPVQRRHIRFGTKKVGGSHLHARSAKAGSGSRRASLFREKAERLIDEGVGILEDAAMARIRENAELRVGKGFEQRD